MSWQERGGVFAGPPRGDRRGGGRGGGGPYADAAAMTFC